MGYLWNCYTQNVQRKKTALVLSDKKCESNVFYGLYVGESDWHRCEQFSIGWV